MPNNKRMQSRKNKVGQGVNRREFLKKSGHATLVLGGLILTGSGLTLVDVGCDRGGDGGTTSGANGYTT